MVTNVNIKYCVYSLHEDDKSIFELLNHYRDIWTSNKLSVYLKYTADGSKESLIEYISRPAIAYHTSSETKPQ